MSTLYKDITFVRNNTRSLSYENAFTGILKVLLVLRYSFFLLSEAFLWWLSHSNIIIRIASFEISNHHHVHSYGDYNFPLSSPCFLNGLPQFPGTIGGRLAHTLITVFPEYNCIEYTCFHQEQVLAAGYGTTYGSLVQTLFHYKSKRCLCYTEPRLNIRKDVLSLDLVKSRSHEIGTLNCRIALKFDRHIGSNAAEVPVKFQSDRTILNTNLATWRLHEILR